MSRAPSAARSTAMRKRWADRRARLGIPETKVCEQCGETYSREGLGQTNHHWLGRRFCKMACRNAAIREGKVFRRGAEHHAWKGENASTQGVRKRGQAMRRRESDGYCESCRFMLATETHHRDRDISNNDRENLEFLCLGCHDLAHIGETVWDPPVAVAA